MLLTETSEIQEVRQIGGPLGRSAESRERKRIRDRAYDRKRIQRMIKYLGQ